MKKILFAACLAAAMTTLFSCNEEGGSGVTPVTFTLQATCGEQPLQLAGISVSLFDAGSTKFDYSTDSLGKVTASLPAGLYTWSASGEQSLTDTLYKYNGASSSAFEVKEGMDPVSLSLNKVIATSSIIIKELYNGGFTDDSLGAKTGIDSYVILYNNSAASADASDFVITYCAPYNASGNNKYYSGGSLLYETADWIPAYGAIWRFTSPVTIPAYSQIVVACFGAIDHTQTYKGSVNLSNSEYYWMSNQGITQYSNAKYTASESIPATHYLTCKPFTQGNAWALSVSAAALYIGKIAAADVDSLSLKSSDYDHTLGTSAAFNVVKFPKASVVDAIEIWEESKVASSNVRFPAAINTGYTVLTNKAGHTSYRNVDQTATEALSENAGKLVYGYEADPCGIDAEASIKNGAHIIYKDTNNSGNDFHQRSVASIK